MLGLFRNNQITTLLFLVVYAGLLHLPMLLGWVLVPAEPPGLFPGIFYNLLPDVLVRPGLFSLIAALALIIVQAVWIYRLTDRFRLMDDRTWLPALGYVMVVSCLPQTQYLSAPLIAVTFVLPVLARAFNLYKKIQVTAATFDMGFWLSIGSLFYPPLLILFIPLILLVRSLRSFSLHERVILVVGTVLPYFLAWTWMFWTDQTPVFLHSFLDGLKFQPGLHLPAGIQEKLSLGIVGLMLLVILLNAGSYFYKRLIQVQKYMSGLLWLIFTCLAAMVLFRQPLAWQYLLMAPSMGILLGITLNDLKNRLLAEILHLVLLACIFFIQFYPYLF